MLDCAAPAATDAVNACVGPAYCEPQPPTAPKPYACVANHALTKVCDDSLDSACLRNACLPATGVCALTTTERTALICDLPPPSPGAPVGCRRQVLLPTQPAAAAAPCDDGLACSIGDGCQGGSCVASDQSACKCLQDVDCVDDGDLCNGKPYCDASGGGAGGAAPWTCKINPATLITCDQSGVAACMHSACAPSTGVCGAANLAAGTACDDGVACTKGDVCDGVGGCQPGTWTCCKVDSDCASFEDGDLCNGTLFCNLATGACATNPATAIVCPSANDSACAKAQCVKASGACVVAAVNAGGACDDGDACSVGEACSAGLCQGGVDNCPCQGDADCAKAEDGDLCNGTMFCVKSAGQCAVNPATIVACPSVDDSPCRKNTCTPKTGKCAQADLPASATCEADGTACTANDSCDGKGKCLIGTAICPCLGDADCKASDDGDACNGSLYCDKGGAAPVCKINPATVKTCPNASDGPCVKTACVPASGLCASKPEPAGIACEDGVACTDPDTCDGAGTCVSGPGLCPCSDDAACAPLDDGDPCNGAQLCVKGVCKSTNGPPNCDDGNVCTADACASDKGCTGKALTSTAQTPHLCDDGDPCATDDACVGGLCKAGSPMACDDLTSCTVDSCKPGLGCKYAPVVSCGDADCGCGETSVNGAADCPPECGDGAPKALVFVQQPADGSAGAPLGAIKVEVRGADGKVCGGAAGLVAVTLAPLTSAGAPIDGATLQGATPIAPQAGVAVFSSLSIAKAGAGYRLIAAMPGVAPTTSAAFSFAVGSAKALVFAQQPSAAVAGVAVAPSVAVAVIDAGGNVVVAAKGMISLQIATGSASAKLIGASAAIQAGVATYTDLAIATAGAYTLQATSGALIGTSGSFSVVAAAADAKGSSLNATPPGAPADGKSAIALKATIADAFGNPVANQAVVFDVAGDGAALTQPAKVTDSAGVTSGSIVATTPGAREVTMAVAGKPLGAATVTFSAGAADPAQCALTPSKGSATADGKDAITLEAVIRDAKGASDCNDGNALLVPGGAEVCDDIDNGCGKFTPKALAQVEAPDGMVKVVKATDYAKRAVSASKDMRLYAVRATVALAGDAIVTVKVFASEPHIGTTSTGLLASVSRAVTLGASKGMRDVWFHFNGLPAAKGGTQGPLPLLKAGATLWISVTAANSTAWVPTSGTSVVAQIYGSEAPIDPGCDDDGDGHCDAKMPVEAPVSACILSASGPGDDCDDGASSVKPGGIEVCDGVDQDCDSKTDEAPACDDSNECTVDVCQGTCKHSAVSNGTPCFNGTCTTGKCIDKGASAIAVTHGHACAISVDGTLRCWGKNDLGQIGVGDLLPRSAPTPVVGLPAAVKQISVVSGQTCALLTTGQVYCWGGNAKGQLGDGTTKNASAPVAVKGLEPGVQRIEVGFAFACALTATSSVVCWGLNYYGQLGNGDITDTTVPGQVTGLDSGVVELVLGGYHGCARLASGPVKCWVYNNYRQIGDGSAPSTNAQTPKQVTGLSSGVAKIAAGDMNSCAIMATGSLRCWGGNSSGGLGIGDTSTPSQPVQVSGLTTGVASVAVGGSTSCALLTNKSVRCWGYNARSGVGNGTTKNQLTPTPVLGLIGSVKALSAGSRSCALWETGALRCWGDNEFGALGIGVDPERATAGAVQNLPAGVVRVAPDSHACAGFADGSLHCWGNNSSGQLGDGSTDGEIDPAGPIALSGGAATVAVSNAATCAIGPNGALSCWGATPMVSSATVAPTTRPSRTLCRR